MAKVKIIICSSLARSNAGSNLDIPRSEIVNSVMAESSTTAAIADIEGDPVKVNNVSTRFWCIVSKGWILVKMGTGDLTFASDDEGWMIPPGVPMFFTIEEDGEKILIKDI